ncbi:hypothetical protein IQ07DRAFT_685734 [Pyrenochaeta sp. DS3sAY3a]|nr:hypothetical protein IQ07DRAFT_685734 [Pyrenochaeta sp. DS3sAY3a]
MSSNNSFWVELGQALSAIGSVVNSVNQIASSAQDMRNTYKAFEENAIRNDPMVKRYEKLEKELKDLSDPFSMFKR